MKYLLWKWNDKVMLFLSLLSVWNSDKKSAADPMLCCANHVWRQKMFKESRSILIHYAVPRDFPLPTIFFFFFTRSNGRAPFSFLPSFSLFPSLTHYLTLRLFSSSCHTTWPWSTLLACFLLDGVLLLPYWGKVEEKAILRRLKLSFLLYFNLHL